MTADESLTTINIRTPKARRDKVPGSGTAPTWSVKSWFEPLPQLHTYVPGVAPKLLKVTLFHVELLKRGVLET
jgi:hypothetical protein